MSAAFLSKEEMSICVTQQLRSSGGCKGEPITSNISLGRFSKRWRRKSYNEADNVMLQWLWALKCYSQADWMEKSLLRQQGLSRQGTSYSSCTCPSSRTGVSLARQVCLSQNTVIVYHKTPASDASLKRTLNKYFFLLRLFL